MRCAIPLADIAQEWIEALGRATGWPRIAEIDGETLLGERAMLGGFAIPGRTSAGGGCRLFDARDGAVALNLSRSDDRDLLPALFELALDPNDDRAIAAAIGQCEAAPLVARGRDMGLAIAGENETAGTPAVTMLVEGHPAPARGRRPRVIDLSALWAGPLAAHLLWLAGAEVVKIESLSRPDAMREGDPRFFALLNQGKASVALDLKDADDRRALLALIAESDIVIEAARPRALAQLGIDVDAIVRARPGLGWVTITGHGAQGEQANWVAFGDDCGVAAGLTAALRKAGGRPGFVGDAIGDPLTGIRAAQAAWEGWALGRSGRIGLSMRGTVADALAQARAAGPRRFDDRLRAWSASAGMPFPAVARRAAGPVAALGADNHAYLGALAPC